jgi:hypothetical protein
LVLVAAAEQTVVLVAVAVKFAHHLHTQSAVYQRYALLLASVVKVVFGAVLEELVAVHLEAVVPT